MLTIGGNPFIPKHFIKGAPPERILTRCGQGKPGFLEYRLSSQKFDICTGKSFSEALILALTNPQYYKRLFIDLPVQYMKTTSSEHVVYINCFFVFVLTFKTILVHNMF